MHGVPILSATGNVDVTNAAVFERVLEKVAEGTKPSDTMIVSFEACGYFDSVAAGVLIKFLRVTTKNRVILVASPQSALAKVFELVGFSRMCSIVPSRDAALSAIAVSA